MDKEKKKYPTPRGAAANAAKLKYRDKTYDRIEIVTPIGTRTKIENAVNSGGYASRNEFIMDAIQIKYKEVMGEDL